MLTDQPTCARCWDEGWICETHPVLPSMHDGCGEPGEPCPLCNTGEPPRKPRGWVSLVRTEPEPIDLAAWPPVPPPQTPSRETLWTVRRSDGVEVSARLLWRGEWGVEAQILHDGELLGGHRFDTRAQAVRWAEEERKAVKARR